MGSASMSLRPMVIGSVAAHPFLLTCHMYTWMIQPHVPEPQANVVMSIYYEPCYLTYPLSTPPSMSDY